MTTVVLSRLEHLVTQVVAKSFPKSKKDKKSSNDPYSYKALEKLSKEKRQQIFSNLSKLYKKKSFRKKKRRNKPEKAGPGNDKNKPRRKKKGKKRKREDK